MKIDVSNWQKLANVIIVMSDEIVVYERSSRPSVSRVERSQTNQRLHFHDVRIVRICCPAE
jgi:predicted NUDIX family phosphoesterase